MASSASRVRSRAFSARVRWALATLFEVNRRICLADPNGRARQHTIFSVPAVLTSPPLRQELRKVCADPFIDEWWDTYDGFRFAYQQLAGDGSVSARVVSQNKSGKGGIWQKSGVMLRAINGTNVDPSAPYYGVFVTPSNGVVVQYRTQEAAYTAQPVQIKGTAAPVFLKVSRFTDPNTRSTQYSAYPNFSFAVAAGP